MSPLALHVPRTVATLSLTVALLLACTVAAGPAAAATPTRATAAGIAARVLTLMNSERAHSHLPALRTNSRLVSSAHSHNLAMARRDTMSHQVPGEASFAARISHSGYDWSSAGENIAWNADWTLRGAYEVQEYMYGEGASYDVHRRNIVSRVFRDVGVDIYMDAAHHRMWLTEDFGRSG